MKKILSPILAFIMIFSSVCSTGIIASAAESDNVVVYDANEFDTFKNRTMQDVADAYSNYKYTGETYIDGDKSAYYDVAASTVSPYEPGVLTADTHKAMTGMTNFYRWLLGEELLKAESANSDSLQAQALIRNFQFDHSVSDSSKPSDMSDELWNYGKSVNHNILALGFTPQGAVTGWINEGYSLSGSSWTTVGHRNALIAPNISDVQYGFSGNVSIGLINGRSNSYTNAFTAFPAPGYMPRELVRPDECAWSVYLDSSKVKASNAGNVLITVTNLNSGNSYTRKSGDKTASVSTDFISFVQPPDYTTEGYSIYYSDSYRVEITGLTDSASGKSAKIVYTVIFTDLKDSMSSFAKTAAVEKDNYIIYTDYANTEFLKKVGSIIPKEVIVTAENGRKVTVPTNGNWVLDEANSCWENTVDASKLPINIIDKNNILAGKIKVNYTISDDYYDRFNSLTMPSKIKEGESGTVEVHRTLLTTDTSKVFKVTSDGSGNYTSVERLNSNTSPEFNPDKSKESSSYHIYDVVFNENDSGEYISVYYNSNEWHNEIYVSTGSRNVTVTPANQKLTNDSTVSKTTLTTGERVVVKGAASGGSGGYTYAFYYKPAQISSWSTLGTEFGSTSTVSYSSYSPATYNFLVKVKDSDGNIAEKNFTVEFKAPQSELVNESVVTPYYKGFSIQFKASGGSGDYTYAYNYKKSGSTDWEIAEPKFKKIDGCLERLITDEPSYDILVKVKDSDGNIAEKTFTVDLRIPPEEQTELINESVVTPYYKGFSIKFKASGGSGFYTYAYNYKKSGSTDWEIAEPKFKKIDGCLERLITDEPSYDILVKVKDSDGNIAEKTFTVDLIIPPEEQTELINESVVTPHYNGFTIKGAASGGTGFYKYAYFYKESTDSDWEKFDNGDFISSTYVGIVTPQPADSYDVLIKVMDSDGTIAEKTITVNIKDALKNESTVSKTSAFINDKVTIKGAASGGSGGYKYAFYYKLHTNSDWILKGTEYGSATVAYLYPSNAAQYDIMVKVKDSDNNIVSKTFTLDVSKSFSNNSTVSAVAVNVGDKVTIKGAASGGSGGYKYAFYYKLHTNSDWILKGTEYGSATTAYLYPSNAAQYDIMVKVKDSEGKVVTKTFTVNVTK